MSLPRGVKEHLCKIQYEEPSNCGPSCGVQHTVQDPQIACWHNKLAFMAYHEEIDATDIKPRKLLTMHGLVHPESN